MKVNRSPGRISRTLIVLGALAVAVPVFLALAWTSGAGRQRPTASIEPEPPSRSDDCTQDDISRGLHNMELHEAVWAEVEKLATLTPRIALAGPISDLQRVHRMISDVWVPPCMSHVLRLHYEAEEHEINQMLGFMGDDPSLQIGSMHAKDRAIEQQTAEMAALLRDKFPAIRKLQDDRAKQAEQEEAARRQEADRVEKEHLAATVEKARLESERSAKIDAIHREGMAKWKAENPERFAPVARSLEALRQAAQAGTNPATACDALSVEFDTYERDSKNVWPIQITLRHRQLAEGLRGVLEACQQGATGRQAIWASLAAVKETLDTLRSF